MVLFSVTTYTLFRSCCVQLSQQSKVPPCSAKYGKKFQGLDSVVMLEFQEIRTCLWACSDCENLPVVNKSKLTVSNEKAGMNTGRVCLFEVEGGCRLISGFSLDSVLVSFSVSELPALERRSHVSSSKLLSFAAHHFFSWLFMIK